MHPVLVATLALAGLCALLALLLVAAEKFFVESGDVALKINSESEQVPGGEPLLTVLREKKIFIPSACGGQGSCGLCQVKVLKGGGQLLPTEKPHLTPEDIADSMRLSCQLKVRTDIDIEIPEHMLEVREFVATVEKIERLTHDIKRLTLAFDPADDFTFRAGQYIQLETPIYDGIGDPVYRAYSISCPPQTANCAELIVRKVPRGIATTYIHELMVEGDRVKLNGPYGDFFLRDTSAEAIFIAGGSGLAPFESIIEEMIHAGSPKKATLFFGALSARDLYDLERLRGYGEILPRFTVVPALSQPLDEDNWQGRIGLITEVVRDHYPSAEGMEGYLCGSPGMIDACIEVLLERGMDEADIYFDKFG